MRIQLFVLLIGLALAGVPRDAAADPITVLGANADVEGRGTGAVVSDGGFDDTAPFAVSASITPDAASAASATTAGSSGGTVSGTFGTDAHRTDSYGRVIGSFSFTTSSGAVAYAIDGDYGFTGGDGTAYYRVYLIDNTTNTYVFDNEQVSYDVSGESFVTGQTGGTLSNLLIGSLSGTLAASRLYTFGFDAYAYNAPGHLNALSGSADATLTISAVPEPASLALFSLGAGALALRRRRRRA